MESTSDDEETVSIIEFEISPTANHTEHPSTPDTQCSICLGDLINKCYSNSCCHLFCFECLKRWSDTIPTCPLCKTFFTHIYHTVSEHGVYETYNVPHEIPEAIPIQEFNELTIDANRLNLFRDMVNISDLINNYPELINNDDSGASFLEPIEDYGNPVMHILTMGHATRLVVYIENLWAEPLPDSSGRYRDCSPAFFRNNPSQIHRLFAFIHRDLFAVRESTRYESRASNINETYDDTIINLIIQSISIYEIRDSFMVNILQPFLAEYTIHFCHELYNYANSPYDIFSYDRHVQFSVQDSSYTHSSLSPPAIIQSRSEPTPDGQPGPIINETIVLDSDEEVDQMTTMADIVLSSESDGSDVEMITDSSNITLSSSLMDQASTSTGIQDSLVRPNNRRKLVSPTVNGSSSIPVQTSEIAHGISRRPVLDTSSDDEELTTTSQTQARTKLLKKKRKIKKK